MGASRVPAAETMRADNQAADALVAHDAARSLLGGAQRRRPRLLCQRAIVMRGGERIAAKMRAVAIESSVLCHNRLIESTLLRAEAEWPCNCGT